METLSRLWMEGRTASQIADSLGNGITRNAVIGKVHRLGLCDGENVGLRAAAIASSASVLDPGDQNAPKDISESAPSFGSGGKEPDRMIVHTKKRTPTRPSSIAISDLTDDTCRWPVDDPGSMGFRYCGAPVGGPAPYCARHSKLAYQPTKPIRRPPDRNAVFPGLLASATKS